MKAAVPHGHRRVFRSRRTTREVFFIVSFQFFFFFVVAFAIETLGKKACGLKRLQLICPYKRLQTPLTAGQSFD